jgi:predicted RNA-binding protein YlxR (DUF448 family)
MKKNCSAGGGAGNKLGLWQGEVTLPTQRRKHVPMRTCIACRQKRPKRELIRVVRRPEGAIEIDLKGKLSGRGAYLCATDECWHEALEERKLAKALQCQVSAEQVLNLRAVVAPLLAEQGLAGLESLPGEGECSK